MNIYSQISSINKSSPKPGGLCKIQFIPWEQILNWPNMNPSSNTISEDFILAPGYQLYELDVADKDRMFKEDVKEGPQGSYYDQILTARSSGFSRQSNFTLQSMVGHRFGVFFSDRYGDIKVIGNKDFGAQFIYNYTSGDNSSTRSVMLQFKIESVVAATVIDNLVPIPAFGFYSLEYAIEYE